MAVPFTSTLLEQLGHELGIAIELEPQFRQVGSIRLSEHTYSYFKVATLDCNPSGSAKIASDKAYASYFMSKLGYAVPEGQAFFSDAWCSLNKTSNNRVAACAYAAALGYPVIIKPNSKAQGVGVMRVASEEALKKGLDLLFTIDNIVLVQRVLAGKDYRFIVYKDSVPIAYERQPLSVVGTGDLSLSELLLRKQKELEQHGRMVRIAESDDRLQARLDALGLHMTYVPRVGERVQLLDNANMSSGGEAIDWSDKLHSSCASLAVAVTRGMGLTLCGVDVMMVGRPDEQLGAYAIVEINNRPGLEHYAALGDTALRRVKDLYRTILKDIMQNALY